MLNNKFLIQFKRTIAVFLLVGLLVPQSQHAAHAFFDFTNILSSSESEEGLQIPKIANIPIVAILVGEEILGEEDLLSRVERYGQDVQKALRAKVVQIPIPSDTSPLEIYEGLAHLYSAGLESDGASRLIGTVLVGNVPIPIVDKNKNLWPTIFPYVDFTDQAYLWSQEKQRFVFQGKESQPEIWHSVIRSMNESSQARTQELKDYFDNNHQVHIGEEVFSKKIFFADFLRQKKVIAPLLYQQYLRWLRYAEESAYLRFTKHLAKQMLQESKEDQEETGADLSMEVPAEKIEEIVDNILASNPDMTEEEVRADMDRDTLDQIPDNKSKNIIDNLIKRYQETYKGWLSKINGTIQESSRWEAPEIDTTISLITKKDEASILLLKSLNNELEEKLLEKLDSYNVPEHISVLKTQDVLVDDGDDDYYYVSKPLYWNGVLQSEMDSEDCTLIRGSNRSTLYPFAQMVEANRTLNVQTVNSCDAEYEGCCAQNLIYESGEFSYDTCDTTSTWSSPVSNISNSVHQGATLPVYDAGGTMETDGLEGVEGCADIVKINNPDSRFTSLFKHDEPRNETITAQVEVGITRAMPVDDPRGYSFLDHGRTFKRLEFFNIFNYRVQEEDQEISDEDLQTKIENGVIANIQKINQTTNSGNNDSDERRDSDYSLIQWPGTLAVTPGVPSGGSIDGGCTYGKNVSEEDQFTEKITWTEDCDWTLIGSEPDFDESTVTANNTIYRLYETGDMLPEDVLSEIFNKVGWDRILEALQWLDKDIEQKNIIALEKVFSDPAEFRRFFYNQDQEGYEFLEIISEGDSFNGPKLAFLPEGVSTQDEDYLDVLNIMAGFSYDMDPTPIRFLGLDFEKDILGIAEIENQEEDDDDEVAYSFISLGADAGKAEKTGTMGISSNFGPNSAKNSQLAKIKITPGEIRTPISSTSPILVEVTLQDRKNKIIATDYGTEVTLNFDTEKAGQFFTITPSQTIPVTSGKAKFFLIPKTAQSAGRFRLIATAEDKKSQEVLVKVADSILRVNEGDGSLQAGNETGIILRAKVQTPQGDLSNHKDGEIVAFSMHPINNEAESALRGIPGHFQGDNEAVVNNAVAQIRFFPGRTAQDVKIVAEDKNKKLPIADIDLIIPPNLPAKVKLDLPSQFFVRSPQFKKISAEITDRFGNKIPFVRQNIDWQVSGAEVQNSTKLDTDPNKEGIQLFARKGKSTIFVRPEKDASQVTIKFSSDIITQSESNGTTLQIIDDAQFKIQTQKEEIVAGSVDPILVSVKAQTKDEEIIDGDYEVQIVPSDEEVGQFPKTVQLQKGRGVFEFFPGIKSGKVEVGLQHAGFKPASFHFEVLPDEAKKVVLAATQTDIDLSKVNPIFLDVKVVDRFGNQAPGYIPPVSIRLTDATSDLLKLEKATLNLISGKETIKAWGGKLTGKVHVIAEAEGLVPDALELDLNWYFPSEKLATLFPKTLFSLLLGFDAGDFRQTQNFADRLLFTGKTQAVGTLLADPKEKYRFASIAPSGEIVGNTDAKLQQMEFPEISITDTDDTPIANARILFNNPPEIIFEQKPDLKLEQQIAEPEEEEQETEQAMEKKSEIYIQVEQKMYSRVELENQTLFFSEDGHTQEPLITFSENGGVSIQSKLIEINKTSNILEWKILLDDESLGLIKFQTQDNIYVVDDFEENDSENDTAGIQIKPVVFEIKTDEVFVGASNHEEKGIALISKKDPESSRRKLGSSFTSSEDALASEAVVWSGDWKPGTLFAAKNTVGDSVKWGSNDSFILFGDPSLSVQTENDRSDFGFSKDLGKPIWKSTNGSINKILVGDVNGDEAQDLLVLVQNKLSALYQAEDAADTLLTGEDARDVRFQTHNFRDIVAILNFKDGVVSLITLDNDDDGFTDLVQLNDDGEVFLHKNTQGTFKSEVLGISLSEKIINLKTGNLNKDGISDLILLDEKNNIYTAFGHSEGFFAPQLLENFSPEFETVDEGFSSQEQRQATVDRALEYLPRIQVSFAGITVREEEGVVPRSGPAPFFFPNQAEREVGSKREAMQALQEGQWFIPLTYDSTFTSELEIKLMDQSKKTLQSGDQLIVKLTIKPNEKIQDFEFQPFSDPRLKFLSQTLECEGCEGGVDLKLEKGLGDFWAYGVDLPAREKSVFSWNLEVQKVPPLDFFIGDFDGDNTDDISVSWETPDGNPKLIQYLSTQKSAHIANWHASVDPDFQMNYNKKATITPVASPTPELPDAAFTSEGRDEIAANFKADNNSNNLSDNYENGPSEDVDADNIVPEIAEEVSGIDETRYSYSCGGGTCFGIPNSVASYAPGLISYYPYPYQAYPVGKDPGDPVSSYRGVRDYLMPTTTGKLAEATCTGDYDDHMVTGIWNPNCYASVRTPPRELGLCPQESPDPNLLYSEASSQATGASGAGLVQVSGASSKASANNGSFKTKSSPINNVLIRGPNVPSNWLREQGLEISNKATLQNATYSKPDIRRVTAEKGADGFVATETGGVESTIAAIRRNPLFEITEKTIVVPVLQADEVKLKSMCNAIKERAKDDPVAQNEFSICEDNLATLRDYNSVVEQLMNLRKDQQKVLSAAVEYSEILADYGESVNATLAKSMAEWEQSKRAYKQVRSVWQQVPQMFHDFKMSCQTCIVDRGTLLPWLQEFFLDGAKFPIIKIPRDPDLVVDYSNVGGTIKMVIPKPVLNVVEVSDANFSKYRLPKVSKTDFSKIDIPPLTLPTLPELPSPPLVPNILASLLDIIEKPKSLTSLFCLLRLGVADVPEWYLKPYVEQLTNREALLEIDYADPPTLNIAMANASVVTKPAQNKLSTMKDIAKKAAPYVDIFNDMTKELKHQHLQSTPKPIIPGKEGAPIKSIEARNSFIPWIKDAQAWAKTFKNTIKNSTGFSPATTLLMRMQEKAQTTLAKSTAQNRLREQVLAFEIPEKYKADHKSNLLEINQKWRKEMHVGRSKILAAKQKVENENEILFALRDLSLNKFLAQEDVQRIFHTEKRYLATGHVPSFENLEIIIPRESIVGYLAFSNIDEDNEPEPPEAKEIEIPQISPDEENAVPESGRPDRGIYFTDPDTGLNERITDFPLFGQVHQLLSDVDDDGTEEIIFTLGSELYIKERFALPLTIPVEQGVVHWDFEKFKALFSPFQIINSNDLPRNESEIISTLNFSRFSEDIKYFEWVDTNRPESLLQSSISSEKRIAKTWDRYGFLILPSLPMYASSPVSARVTEVDGSPRFSQAPVENVPITEDCGGDGASPPIFGEGGTFVARGKSRFYIRLLQRGWRKEVPRLISLQKNEQLTLPPAEICLERGDLVMLKSGELEVQNLVENQFLTSVARVELGLGEEVQLEFYDGTKIMLYGGEKYFFQTFPATSSGVNYVARQKNKNHYGFIRAKIGELWSLPRVVEF